MRTESIRRKGVPATSCRKHDRVRKGVTLVEVAVATFLLGVLAFTLAPTLASARVSSKESRCFANLMQIGFANAVYASRELSDPALPVHRLQTQQDPQNPTFIGAYEWGGKSGVGRPGYQEHPGILGSKYGTATGFGPPTRPLNAILFKDAFVDAWAGLEFDRLQAQVDMQLDLSVVRCPSDTGYTGIHFPEFRDSKQSSFDHFGTSYTANMFTVSNQGGGEMRSNSPYLHRLSELNYPGRTLAYYENCGRFAWSAAPMPGNCQWLGDGFSGTVVGWHDRPWAFNAAFTDGHADTILMRSFANPSVLEDENLQGSFRCIIVRGENWNKDTLPQSPISTGLWHSSWRPRSSWEGGIE